MSENTALPACPEACVEALPTANGEIGRAAASLLVKTAMPSFHANILALRVPTEVSDSFYVECLHLMARYESRVGGSLNQIECALLVALRVQRAVNGTFNDVLTKAQEILDRESAEAGRRG